MYLLAVLGSGFAVVAAEEELAVEQLDPHHRKDEEEQHVHDQDIEHISKQHLAYAERRSNTKVQIYLNSSWTIAKWRRCKYSP